MAIKESTHFYDREGLPAYEVPYADPTKGMRSTTLRDAKKLSLCPSVTAILNIPAKPGLAIWKQNQLLDAAFSCKVENEKDWKISVLEIANEVSKTTREKGTAIHAAVEKGFLDKEQETEMYNKYYEPVHDVLEIAYGDIANYLVPQQSFAHPLGYGGKVDLHADGLVIDLKTKDFTEDADPKKLAYPENAMQLDAYRQGLFGDPTVKDCATKMVNVFIDRETGIVKLYEWPSDGTYFEQFKCLLKYWQLSRSYDSAFTR